MKPELARQWDLLRRRLRAVKEFPAASTIVSLIEIRLEELQVHGLTVEVEWHEVSDQLTGSVTLRCAWPQDYKRLSLARELSALEFELCTVPDFHADRLVERMALQIRGSASTSGPVSPAQPQAF